MRDGTELDSPRLLENLVIRGLHGYKDIEIAFPKMARIVIAENGSGKTTVLSALSLLLNKDLYHLWRLPFDSIELDLVGHERTIGLDRSDLEFVEHADDVVKDIAVYLEVPTPRIIQALLESSDWRRSSSKMLSRISEDFYRRSPYSRDEAIDRVNSVRDSLHELFPYDVKETINAIESVMGEVRVLHLPTYRRIEAPLERQERQSGRSWQRTFEFEHGSQPKSLVGPLDLGFGLADVSDRLRDLSSQIQRTSNIGYRQLFATIIDDLLEAGTEALRESSTKALPDLESLKTFLSSVESGNTSEERTRALAKLYDGTTASNDFQSQTLKYFLSKLAKVVDQTKEQESNIANFLDRVNSYLSSSSEEKLLSYNAKDMRVEVRNQWTGRVVEMDDLSSGEKQVISLFSHLYLCRGNNLVLIDEPELSLSIEWQKKILPDIVDTPSCAQLLAFTHSPFIFDNTLDPVAGPMIVRRNMLHGQSCQQGKAWSLGCH